MYARRMFVPVRSAEGNGLVADDSAKREEMSERARADEDEEEKERESTCTNQALYIKSTEV